MNNTSYLYSYLLSLIGGVLLVILHGRDGLFTAITIIVGILFLLPGLLAVGRGIKGHRGEPTGPSGSEPLMIVVGALAAIFGLLLIITPHLFVNFIFYAFGLLMIIGGVVQLINFSPKHRSLGFSGIFMVVPVLAIIIGVVVIIVGAEKLFAMLAMITGIVMIVYGVNGLIGYADRAKRIKGGGSLGHQVEIQ